MIDVLRQEAALGFPHLDGARLSGTLCVTQAALNDGLRRLPQVPPGVALEIRDGNAVAVRYGMLHATAVIDEVVDVRGSAPRFRLALASALVALALRAVLRGPAMFVEGRSLTIDIGAFDPASRHRRYWSLLTRMRVRTATGQVHVEFEAAV